VLATQRGGSRKVCSPVCGGATSAHPAASADDTGLGAKGGRHFSVGAAPRVPTGVCLCVSVCVCVYVYVFVHKT